MQKTKDIADFLNKELDVGSFEDVSHNGLQVQNSGKVSKVCTGVDASIEFFEAAAQRGANLLICHHGISWGDSLSRITELNYRRIRFLMDHDIALYACHLPLDAHPRYGNNALICRALGLGKLKSFGRYGNRDIGFVGQLAKPMRYTLLKKKIQKVVGNELQTMDFGKKTVRSVAVVSGGAAEGVEEAGKKGIDVFITGESKLYAYGLSQEYGLNTVFAGHYATEVFGVRALGQLLQRRLKLKSEFIDLGVTF
jgi:dinuclear metal center YbgI/SA1388 family protein